MKGLLTMRKGVRYLGVEENRQGETNNRSSQEESRRNERENNRKGTRYNHSQKNNDPEKEESKLSGRQQAKIK